MSINNGDMPSSPIFDSDGFTTQVYDSHYATGLTKREHFAALAMQGVLGAQLGAQDIYEFDEKSVSSVSVKMADALLKELDK